MLEATIIAFGASITCLAQAVYFEARDQPTIGQMAVAQVVLNRVHDSRWPDTVCEVVKEGPTYSWKEDYPCLLYTSPSPRDVEESRMPSSA